MSTTKRFFFLLIHRLVNFIIKFIHDGDSQHVLCIKHY